MFTALKNAFVSWYTQLNHSLAELFGRAHIDETALADLERILLTADVGVATTQAILVRLRERMRAQKLSSGADLQRLLRTYLEELLTIPHPATDKRIYLLVGINGSGKTTAAAKLAYQYTQQGFRVLLVAADTFRAAAVQQLQQWAESLRIPVVAGTPGQDPASVVFAGCQRFIREQFDYLIIDTAGRLQTKTHLMDELAKIKRTITKQCGADQVLTLLTIDSLLGQNSFEQAKLFHAATAIDGVILTKTDGTSKGGIVLAIAHQLKIPIIYGTNGEEKTALYEFNATAFINRMMQ